MVTKRLNQLVVLGDQFLFDPIWCRCLWGYKVTKLCRVRQWLRFGWRSDPLNGRGKTKYVTKSLGPVTSEMVRYGLDTPYIPGGTDCVITFFYDLLDRDS